MIRPTLHKRQSKQTAPTRATASSRGYDGRWQKIRLQFLFDNPLCQDCEQEGRTVAASEVDHIDGNVGNMDNSNFRALCKSHHSRKTARENGSFGRVAQR
jgi:5-methylcytosine-specific restriction protein A